MLSDSIKTKSNDYKTKVIFTSFTPAVSKAALKAMRAKTKKDNLRNRSDLDLIEI